MSISPHAIPAARGSGPLGVLPNIIRADGILNYLQETALEGGELVALKFGPQTIYLVTGPAFFQHILRDNHYNYTKTDFFYAPLRDVVGNGLATSEGEYWLRQRRMIQPHLHRKQLANIFTNMRDAIADVLARWPAIIEKGDPVDFDVEMSRITMEIIMRVLFRSDALTAQQMGEVASALDEVGVYVDRRTRVPFVPKWVPVPGQATFNRAYTTIRTHVMSLIEAERQNPGEGDNLIALFLNTVDEETGERMTDEQILDEATTIFIAGFDTTSTMLTFVWDIMARHPHVYVRMVAEIDRVVGAGLPTFVSLRELVYTQRVMKETLRLYPPAPMLPRTSIEDDTLGAYDVPAGSTFLLFYYGLHHNPAVWPDPETFDPERFTPEAEAARHGYAYLPFSGGPRKCAGDEFALMEGTLALAMIFQAYRAELVPGHDHRPAMSTGLTPTDPMLGWLRHR